MGDPRKTKKKYSTPFHPWQGARIEEEKILKTNYALKNKKEIWKSISLIKKFKSKAKEIIASQSAQAKIEGKQLIDKVTKLNFLAAGSKIEDVLDLNITTVLERRLQSLVYKKGLARTPKQARQFITHGHVSVHGQRVNIPSYLVTSEDEPFISFSGNSALSNEEHPERKLPEKEEVKLTKPKEVKEDQSKGKKEEPKIENKKKVEEQPKEKVEKIKIEERKVKNGTN